MPRRYRRDVPRWRRGRSPAAFYPYPPQMPARQARAYARQQGAAATAEATSGPWRFRYHLVPFAWLAAVLAAAVSLRMTARPVLWALAASAAVVVLTALFTGHLSRFARRASAAAALVTAAWLPVLAAAGAARPVPALAAATWALFALAQVRHYGWRPAATAEPEPQDDPGVRPDEVIWERLAGRRKWSGRLGPREEIPGGRKYPVLLDGAETHIGQVLTEPRAIAAAWDKPQTEAYAEPHPSGVESRGYLTILKAGTLEEVRDWDGRGFGEDGIGTIGRFADSQPGRIRILVPMDGTRHGLVAGTSGAGKSELLNLLIWLALTSPVPVVPVILDPQNGQSLPQWRDRVLYAAGIEECARMVRGLHAGMMDRSRRLASMTWDDDGHKVKGMEFFDARVTGLPVVMPIMDEAPLLLAGGGNAKLSADMIRLEGESAKLARKTGKSKWVVAQVPSLGELGDQTYRAMLRGGNVVCLRTGEKVSAGMLGLSVDPSTLPPYFPSGEPTQGLGYVVSVDGRQAPFRSDLVPRRMRRQPVEVPTLEPEFLEAMDRAMRGVPLPSAPAAPEPEPADDTPEGRRCVDAVWQVLADAGRPMERGEIIQWVSELTTAGWGRDKPFSLRAVTNALASLAGGEHPGRVVVKPQGGDGGVYQAVPGKE